MLSIRTKESIKTALAMTIAYGIALSMEWDKPMWAGFAVAFVSLSTVGHRHPAPTTVGAPDIGQRDGQWCG